MLSFLAYTGAKPAEKANLSSAYLVGADDVPLRADISFKNGVITCKKRAAGPAGLVLPYRIPNVGDVLLETVRLMERPQPYILSTELARGRLMRISQKLDDWGLIHHEDGQKVLAEVTKARELLIESLQADSPVQSAKRGEAALAQAVAASEQVALFHADAFYSRRKQTGGFPTKRALAVGINTDASPESFIKKLTGAVDMVNVPIVWRDLEPTEQTFHWKPLDAWVEALAKAHIPIKGSALLSFSDRNVPDWLYIWEHDFDTIRDLAFEHARRVINRYGQYIQVWDVISGIHATNCFTFNFEQLMELTRMTAALAKQASPRSLVIVDIVAPWGEYYARNQRTIPPMLYADMTAQGGVNFDAFGLRLQFGGAQEVHYTRDLFQISSLLDQFAKLGKPIYITAAEAPSATKPGPPSEEDHRSEGGWWRGPWSDAIQAEWLRNLVMIVMSKPYVDGFCWAQLLDQPDSLVSFSGLLNADGSAKPAWREFSKLRSDISPAAHSKQSRNAD